MKTTVLILLAVLSISACAEEPKEADYPSQYVVLNTSKVGGFMAVTFCTMSVRDEAAPSLAFIVQKKGACHLWDSGTSTRGRREKNSIKLLVKDDKGKLKVENWPITGSVALDAAAK